MEVKHRLAGSFAAIQHRAVALKELAFPSKLRGDQLQLSEYHLILLACVRQRFEMFPWANQDVRRRLRADILEREQFGIFIHHLRRNLLRPNSAKYTIPVHRIPPAGGSGSRRVTNGVKPSRKRSWSPNCRAVSSPVILPTRTR